MLTGIHGSINIASSTTGVTSQSLNGATAARTGVGEITITLGDKYPELLAADFKILAATAQDLVPQIKSQDMSAKTIVVRLLAGATATDPSSAITLYMNSIFRNSSISK